MSASSASVSDPASLCKLFEAAQAGLAWVLQVVHSLEDAEVAALLKFATACRRPPLGGFRYLNPPFTLHKVRMVCCRVKWSCQAAAFEAMMPIIMVTTCKATSALGAGCVHGHQAGAHSPAQIHSGHQSATDLMHH